MSLRAGPRSHLRDQPLNGKTCCPSTPCLHNGHSGFSLTQSRIHVQQKTCPHVVTEGSRIGSKHNVHFRCWAGWIHPRVMGSDRSYRATSLSPGEEFFWVGRYWGSGVCVVRAMRDLLSTAGALCTGPLMSSAWVSSGIEPNKVKVLLACRKPCTSI